MMPLTQRTTSVMISCRDCINFPMEFYTRPLFCIVCARSGGWGQSQQKAWVRKLLRGIAEKGEKQPLPFCGICMGFILLLSYLHFCFLLAVWAGDIRNSILLAIRNHGLMLRLGDPPFLMIAFHCSINTRGPNSAGW
jgi:hypothetical protein